MSEASSNITPDEKQWRRFTNTLLWVLVLVSSLIYLSILMVDPFDNFPLSPSLERVQVSGSDRQFKPTLARREKYDSVVIGSSSSMLLHPGHLSELLGANFATLSMPSSSPYEQMRLLALFHRHHAAPRYIVMGIDHFWCAPELLPKQLGANVGQPMRDDLYDENHWNDWPALNAQVIKYTRRQIQSLLNPNLEPAAYDGYYNFTVEDYGPYDLQRARDHIYEHQPPVAIPADFDPAQFDLDNTQAWQFPEVENLGRSLAALPAETVKIVLLPPYHWYRLFQLGDEGLQRLAQCKQHLAALGTTLPNYHVIDFMRLSPISLQDTNYWDSQHYNTDMANEMEIMLSEAVLKGQKKDAYFSYMWPE